jgi:hypothetical protein
MRLATGLNVNRGRASLPTRPGKLPLRLEGYRYALRAAGA